MEYLYGFLAVILAVVVLRLLNAHWQRKHWRTRPPRHRGNAQSQRGRVYKDPPPTNYNADPYSGWP
ncbi:hypothetical protein [Arthrobacter sp. 8AJ]|uniref:hypothetical protein n=1 Tax=Arthrobacter sp. 8AJ TaxID=2653130 RepID=UPI0012F4251A|nr:hypothetical protein [Arthrobacter sp. 8AJ]VXB44929.1 conserved hypothetical protein [Arthrobacter sp. 8AJ]